MKGYYIDKNGYILSYAEGEEGLEDFIPCEQEMPCKTEEGLCLKANDERTGIEYVHIQVSEIELSTEMQIYALKQQLFAMDYKTSKRLDGEYTDEEWAEISKERAGIRKQIRELENKLNQ